MTVLLAEATVAVSCHFGCRKPQCLNALSHSALFYSLDVGIRRQRLRQKGIRMYSDIDSPRTSENWRVFPYLETSVSRYKRFGVG
jgi:hypothetical protein